MACLLSSIEPYYLTSYQMCTSVSLHCILCRPLPRLTLRWSNVQIDQFLSKKRYVLVLYAYA